MNTNQSVKKNHLAWIMTLYLLGLFIGCIGTGSITPVRTIIQTSFGADDQLGIWMITIYTLFYAAIIPISGKLADRVGRKIVFLISILLFGVGSVICGLSLGMNSFAVLLVGRVVSAIGAGGIMPVATAEFGTGFPEEKRGMALGLVGGVYGIGNVLGATAGSAILDVFGSTEWQWIFYINIPFCIFIIIAGIFFIPNHKSEQAYKIDKLGTLLMTIIILALLYGLKNLDFFDFAKSLISTDVYPFLIAAVVLVPVFWFVEKRAEDPIFHIEYIKNSQIMLTLAMGLLVGCSMMGMIFIPQFAENAMKIPSGDGGYFVIILGLFAGAVSPISGKFIDKYGAKPVLGAGFIVSILGALYLALIATTYINLFNVIVSLVLIGIGMGLAIGTPLNYMMLKHTGDEDSNSALATLSLIRSIGTAVAPAIMVGFIAQAGAGMQTDLMKEMPKIPKVPKMEQQIELEPIVDELSDSEEFQKQMEGKDLDQMLNMDMDMDMNALTKEDGKNGKQQDFELPDELLAELQGSDVTTIAAACKDMAKYMFDTMTPDVIADIQDGIGEGVDGIGKGIDGISTGLSEMQSGIDKIDAGRAGILKGINGISKGIKGASKGLDKMDGQITGMQSAIVGIEAGIAQLQATIDDPNTPPGLIPTLEQQKADLEDQLNGAKQGLTGIENGRSSLSAKISKMKRSRSSMQSAYNKMGKARSEMSSAMADMQEQKDLMVRAQELMISMKADIPKQFQEVEDEYLKAIDNDHEKLENTYQKTLNEGFKNMYICVTVFNVVGLLLLLLYRDERKNKLEKVEQAKSENSEG